MLKSSWLTPHKHSAKGDNMIAKNIIEDDESAVVIRTDGTNLKIFDGGFATTGDWVIDTDLSVDRAIIYKRDGATNRTEIYVGTPLDVFPSKQIRRYVIRLSNVSFVGTTENNWNEFTESKRGATNPIKYINKNHSRADRNTILSFS